MEVNENLQKIGFNSKELKLASELEVINKRLQNERISERRKRRLLRQRENIKKGIPGLV